ncbi:MAG: Rossman fold protein, TIGR00730 family [Candidatus Lambdaproteobacteria bacterium RIFOXYD2_FULL_50_16]|uniref:Cytokinin riboside 5'-monophosphate phosphoribohydrolase n=1 Tax=Candidatus Lambdaproteobacteria bacterium RIFOXYD2_FULL_50_16 TaxID=1817772 RepID=A0A1F6GDW8_9PROT|nr:MAG: Rossman fold protein, TIGR00730 family [Candidatus Lambdaproteobacteria bacterium RIFOXYD2_FULL_50_16]
MSKAYDQSKPILCYLDEEFLASDEARHVRVLSELTAPGFRLNREGITQTIVFFGSARSKSMNEVRSDIEAIEGRNDLVEVVTEGMKDARVHAEMDLKLARYYEQARELAKRLTLWSDSILQPEKRFTICTGGGPGMMEAANRGASEAGGTSIGFNIHLPMEQDPNPYQRSQLSFEFHYFFVRKFWFAFLAKALIVFPGGFGTMDELFELLTLIQTKKSKKVPIVLYGKEFWNGVFNFDKLLEWRVISPEDLEMFSIVDTVEEAFTLLQTKLTEQFL